MYLTRNMVAFYLNIFEFAKKPEVDLSANAFLTIRAYSMKEARVNIRFIYGGLCDRKFSHPCKLLTNSTFLLFYTIVKRIILLLIIGTH